MGWPHRGGGTGWGSRRGGGGEAVRVFMIRLLVAAAMPTAGATGPGTGRVAIANVVHGDQSAEVRIFGHSAAGETFEGLRVTSEGASSGGLGLGIVLAAAVTPEIRPPALPLVARHGSILWSPSPRFPSPDLSPVLQWSISVADPAVAFAFWDTDLAAFNITDAAWAGPTCGAGGAYELSTKLNVTAAVPGLGPAGVRVLSGVPVTVACDPNNEGKIAWRSVQLPPSFGWSHDDFGVAAAGGRLFAANRAWNGGSHIHNYLVEVEGLGREIRELERPPPMGGSFAIADPQLIALAPGELMMLGGDSSSGGPKADVYRWQEGRGWSFLPSMANRRSNGVAAAVLGDGRVAVAGGYGDSGVLCTSTAEIYDPEAREWGALPDLPKCMQGVSGAALGGRFHVVGGWEFVQGSGLVERGTHYVLQPDANGVFAWTQLAGLPTGRERANGKLVNVGGTLYFVGGTCCGYPGTVQRKVDRYDADTESWGEVAGNLVGHGHPSAGGAVALGGQLVIFGSDGQFYHGQAAP